jgi:hypothetical protein
MKAQAAQSWLTTAELAQRLSLATGTLENWRIRGHGPAWVRLSGKRGPVRYRLSDVLKWEEKQTGSRQ